VNDPLRAAIYKALRSSTPLIDAQENVLRAWHADMTDVQTPAVECAAAVVFFRYFPLRSVPPTGGKADNEAAGATSTRADEMLPSTTPGRRRKQKTLGGHSLEAAVRKDDKGNLVLGGKGPVGKRIVDARRERTGLCAPRFEHYPRDDDGAWLAVIPFLQATLAETVAGVFQAHDGRAVRLVTNTMRIKAAGKRRDVTAALDGVGFVASFVGRVADAIDADVLLRQSFGLVLLHAADMGAQVDEVFDEAASAKGVVARGWVNADYCQTWGGSPTPANYLQWRALQPGADAVDWDSPFISYEHFAGLDRVRPGIRDPEASKRRVAYRGKDKHAADM